MSYLNPIDFIVNYEVYKMMASQPLHLYIIDSTLTTILMLAIDLTALTGIIIS